LHERSLQVDSNELELGANTGERRPICKSVFGEGAFAMDGTSPFAKAPSLK
jgi:hypothetical protein